jgi:hypothetical protein
MIDGRLARHGIQGGQFDGNFRVRGFEECFDRCGCGTEPRLAAETSRVNGCAVTRRVNPYDREWEL